MTTPHKWAEVIHAFAEGKKIQWKDEHNFGTNWLDSSNLVGIDYDHLDWRIKPQKKTYWVSVFKYPNKDVVLSKVYADPTELEISKDSAYFVKIISFDIEE